MKIYRVIFKSIDIDEADNTLIITTFQNRELAEQYLKERIEELKEQEEILKQDDYVTEERKNYYERYLNGRVMEDSVSIYLEEDETYDEIMLKEKAERLEKETNYEM